MDSISNFSQVNKTILFYCNISNNYFIILMKLVKEFIHSGVNIQSNSGRNRSVTNQSKASETPKVVTSGDACEYLLDDFPSLDSTEYCYIMDLTGTTKSLVTSDFRWWLIWHNYGWLNDYAHSLKFKCLQVGIDIS